MSGAKPDFILHGADTKIADAESTIRGLPAFAGNEEKVTLQTKISGLKRLYPETFDIIIKEINRKTVALKDLHKTLAKSREELLSLGVLDNVQIDVDSGKDKNSADVSIFCQESRFSVDVGANMNREGNASIDFNVKTPGVLGGLTSLAASASHSMLHSSDVSARLTNARAFGKNLHGELEGKMTNVDFSATSCFREQSEGVSGSLSDLEGKHSVIAEFVQRDILPTSTDDRRPSNEVLSSRLRTLKSALRYIFLSDETESDEGFATQGMVKRASVEVAGGLGDVTFLKADTTLTKYLYVFYFLQ